MASTAARAETLYSWYIDRGPYFSTPAQVCTWAGHLYDDAGARNMGLGSDDYCREYNGLGYAYIVPYVVHVYAVSILGPSSTTALPAGPALAQRARVTNDGAPVGAGIGVTIKMGSRTLTGVTDGASEVPFVYVPPDHAGSEQITAQCSGCIDGNKTINVDPAQSDSCFGNPVDGLTGAKIQTETDLPGQGAQPLALVRRYDSQGGSASALGQRWTHNWDASLLAGATDAAVRLGDGTQTQFTLEASQSAQQTSQQVLQWQPVGASADRLSSTAQGYAYTRASDDAVYSFDATGVLQSITERGGHAYTLTRDGAGRIATVSNAFGDTLRMSYDGQGNLASVSSAEGTVSYGYDTGRLVRATYADGRSRTYQYEDARWPQALTGITDEAGVRYASYAYDDAGRAISSDHLGTQNWQFTFGSGGNGTGTLMSGMPDATIYRASTRVTGPLGDVQTYQWQGGDGRVMLLGASGPMNGNTIASKQAAATLPTSETDFLGYLTNYQWDNPRRLPLVVTRAAGRPEAQTVNVQWHPVYRQPVLVTQGSRQSASTYDEAGRLLTQTVTDTASGQSRARSWTYDARGLVATMRDEAGGQWTYTHDERGNTAGMVNPLGQATTRAFDAASRLVRETTPDGVESTFGWDARGNLTSTSVAGETTRYTYTPQRLLATVRQPSGYEVSYTYDAAHRLIGASDNRGASIAYTLAGDGTRTREEVRDPQGNIAQLTSRTVDQLGRVQAVLGGAGQATQLQYDANGELIASTDPLNQTTRQSLDALRRPTTTTFPDNAAATRSWSALDALTALTDPKGVTTGYETNAFGEVMRESSPDIGDIRYERDAAGRVSKRTDARGAQAEYERDALGRPTRITRSGPGLAEHVTTYTWDRARAGYLTQVDDPSGSTAYEHDAAGRVLKETRRIAGQTYETRYAYERGELVSIGYPSGLTVYYRRDATGQLTALDTQAPGGTVKKPKPVLPYLTNLTHTALGQPKAWNWTSGDAAARTFNADGAMTGTEFASYTLDAAGRITGITQNLWAASTATGTVTSYTTPLTWTAGYDSRDRLVSFGRAGASTAYTYDANSNRLTGANTTTSDTDLDGDLDDADLTQTTAQASSIDGASNRLLGYTQTVTRTRAGKTRSVVTTPVTRQMDAAGNLTSDGLKSFEYDAANRLVKVRLMKDGEAAVVTYQHNALGQRVFTGEVQAERTPPGQDTLSSGFIAWLKANFKWLFESAQASASIGTAFVYGAGPIPAWALLGDYDNGSATGAGRTEYIWLPQQGGYAIPVGMFRNGRLFAIHTDHLGTPRLMTDDQAQPVWQWPYSAFGDNKPTGVLKATVKPQQAITNEPVMLRATAPQQQLDLGFPGQVRDALLGMDHNYFRTYDRERGIYTQMDPVGMLGGLSRIGYVGASPTNGADPTGLIRYNKPAPATVPPEGETFTALVCLETCLMGATKNLNLNLLVTGGAEKAGHSTKSHHYKGEACDIANSQSNIGVTDTDAKMCAKACGFDAGQYETFPQNPNRDHWHFQLTPGNGVPPLK